jgi:hypothetical protein
MSQSHFEATIISHHDARIGTLARIKTRSLGADTLVLSALGVLTYAQLEGGVKDLAACVIKHVNARKLALGQVSPGLLAWRNQDALGKLRSMVDFDMIGMPVPFAAALDKRVKVNAINRKRELNQMSWLSLKAVYLGFGLDYGAVKVLAAKIDELVSARNDAAHHGAMPNLASGMLESQLRENVAVVEDILTDLSARLLEYFKIGMHRRATGP